MGRIDRPVGLVLADALADLAEDQLRNPADLAGLQGQPWLLPVGDAGVARLDPADAELAFEEVVDGGLGAVGAGGVVAVEPGGLAGDDPARLLALRRGGSAGGGEANPEREAAGEVRALLDPRDVGARDPPQGPASSSAVSRDEGLAFVAARPGDDDAAGV